ncbi:MAG: MarR family transcriptional regulator [Ruminococcaceae bacterium]|nr:MarR family transcriptional regulator [Oscillospiraceae bacterium]
MKRATLSYPGATNPPRHPETPPMLVNEIARLFHCRMRSFDHEGVMLQDSARLIMRELSHSDGCSQLELVHATHLKPPTVSVTLKSMEAEGLVRRESDAMDMRVTRVFLSEKGREHNRRVHERLHTLDEELMRDFSEEETRLLLDLLKRMRNNILPDYSKKMFDAEKKNLPSEGENA